MSYKVIEIYLSPRVTASFIVSSRELPAFLKEFDVVKDHGYVQPSMDNAIESARRLVTHQKVDA